MHKKRGQLLTTDFILSLAIFLAILMTIMSLWASIDTQMREAEKKRDMQSISTYVSDTLMRSRGHPEDWTNETAQVIGLAKEEHVLDLEKVLRLKHMDYDRSRTLLRLANYEFRMWITDGGGYDLTSGVVRSPVAAMIHRQSGTGYARMLNNSVVTWDLYWDDADNLDGLVVTSYGFASRYEYNHNNPEDSLDWLMHNQTQYRTIILEDIGLDNITAANLTGLVEFVQKGGILIYTDSVASTGDPLIGGVFGMEFGPDSGDGEVVATEPLLVNVTAGDTLVFDNNKRYAYRLTDGPVLHTMAEAGGKAKICWWEYGSGRVYYMEDTSGTVTYLSGDPDDALTPHLNVVGEALQYGREPYEYSNLISIRRMGILSGFVRDVINLNIVVWG